MTKEERVKKLINKEEVDYLPSQITFADRTRMLEISQVMGFDSVEKLEEFLQNHIRFTFIKADMPIFYRNDKEMMSKMEKEGFAKVDWVNEVVYDNWGIGWKMFTDGVFPMYHPLQSERKGDKKFAEKFMPDDFIFSDSIEEAIKNFKTPDLDKSGNFDFMKNELVEFSGEYFVIPSGWAGIYDRASMQLIGFEEFMMLIATKPALLNDLFEKITDYKVEYAKKVIKLGGKAGHTSEDLASQTGPLISLAMFRKCLKPHMKRLWKVYKDAGLPMFMHCCGNITEFIPDLIDMGLDVLEPVQPVMDLKYLKKEYGKYITFWGGIDTQKLLPYGTPQEVKRMASETIRTLGQGGGLIIAPSQEVMMDVPIENVKALVETIMTERKDVLK